MGDSSARPETHGSNNTSPNASSLAVRSQPAKRLRKQPSATSLASRTSRSKRLRPDLTRNSSAVSATSRPSASRNNSSLSVKHLLIPNQDDVAITSGDELDSVMEVPTALVRSALASGLLDEALNERPAWAVRHRIYLDSELVSTTTSTRRPGYHKFQDVLLREQTEIRLHTSHSGQDAHFATRHATLRFWRSDGTLAEKWMDKDMGGEQEHEFAMENMNDWTILHLSMGNESEGDRSTDSDQDVSMDQTDADQADESAMTDDDGGAEENGTEVRPTMDIISHYVSDYHDARNIASAPGMNSDDEDEEDDDDTDNRAAIDSQQSRTEDRRPSLVRQNSTPVYHWVEERRRSLEHQLREFFHCTSPSCSNTGGTCFVLGKQHLPLNQKDLTDWSQHVAHAHRSIAATTLHLAAKLVDDRTRDEDQRLADENRERDDEDDLGAVLASDPLLAALRPAGAEADPADLEPLE
ncbi:hypothetical protein ANO11243_026820 [Dothideomycetidae sp. 11243]|nr:hypothetical protein ANO11243_026820 [fungal sp. No.11243]